MMVGVVPVQKEVDVSQRLKKGGCGRRRVCVVWCGAEKSERRGCWVGFAEQPLPSSVSLFTLARPDPLPNVEPPHQSGDSPMTGIRSSS